MGPHIWIFPWLAIAAGLVAVAVSAAAGRTAIRPPGAPSLPRGFFVVWCVVMLVGVIAAEKLSLLIGAQWITPRGLVLGALAGALMARTARRVEDNSFWLAPAAVGLVTATVAAARLWLGYGEIDGLMSLTVGMAISLLCFCVAPAALAPSRIDPSDYATGRGVAALIFTATLVAGVQLGFTRADTPDESYWADIPLLLAGALALMLTIAAALARGGFNRPAWPVTVVVVGTLAVAGPIGWQADKEWRIPLMVGMGVVVALLNLGMNRSSSLVLSSRLGGYVSLLLIVFSAVLGFAYWSGYGVALLALGLWAVYASPVFAGSRNVSPPILICLTFAASLLIYRLALLQEGSAVRGTGPGDIWDLFAICVGALLPVIVSEWARFEAFDQRLPRFLVLIEWLVALILPAIALTYVWQPRSLAGIFLGLALGVLFAHRQRSDADDRDPLAGADRVAVSAFVLSLTMFEFLPVLPQIDAPNRVMRLGVILALSALVIVRLCLPVKAPAAPPVAAVAEA